MIEEIFDFNKLVLSISKNKICELSASEAEFIKKAIDEETKELHEAITSGNIVDQIDALIDLAYFAIGGIYKLGLSAEQANTCFTHIHATNMSKVKGVKQGRSEFKSLPDAVLDSVSHTDLSKLLRDTIKEQH